MAGVILVGGHLMVLPGQGMVGPNASEDENVSLLLVAEPRVSEENRRWVESIRQRHDPNFGVVGLHFTLVFPVSTLGEASFIDHCSQVARTSSPIEFCLRKALFQEDEFSSRVHVYLVPAEGFPAIVRLHDRLYVGPLSRALRLDIPFVPHITVATLSESARAKELADDLNRQGIAIAGSIRAVSAISYDGRSITTLAQISLGGSAD